MISANLGMLFTELPLPDAVGAAAKAGFGAVEFQFPYATPPALLARAAEASGLPVLSVNTPLGQPGDFGLAALPGRGAEARAGIDRAFDYGARLGARFVHVMAGRGPEGDDDVFAANLAHAADIAEARGMLVLIEPINPFDMPGYHLAGLAHAGRLIDRIGRPGIRILFDCYHVARIHGAPLDHFRAFAERVGHVQFAGVPDRAEPDRGAVDYAKLLPALQREGYAGAFGAEYRPAARTEDGLGWIGGVRRAISATGDTEGRRC